MTCIRDILTEEQLEREFGRIRKLFQNLSDKEKPLRIEWGTRTAMEKKSTSWKKVTFWVKPKGRKRFKMTIHARR